MLRCTCECGYFMWRVEIIKTKTQVKFQEHKKDKFEQITGFEVKNVVFRRVAGTFLTKFKKNKGWEDHDKFWKLDFGLTTAWLLSQAITDHFSEPQKFNFVLQKSSGNKKYSKSYLKKVLDSFFYIVPDNTDKCLFPMSK